jgi:hypothetical protein
MNALKLGAHLNFCGNQVAAYFKVLSKAHYFLGKQEVTMTTNSRELTSVQANS